MFSRIEIALALAIVLGATAAASAATKHHRTGQARAPAAEAIITNQCLPTDDPCRTKPDGW